MLGLTGGRNGVGSFIQVLSHQAEVRQEVRPSSIVCLFAWSAPYKTMLLYEFHIRKSAQYT